MRACARSVLASALVLASCNLFGPAAPTLELQGAPAGGPVEVQVVDSAVEPGEIYLRLAVHNRSDRRLVVDRRELVLGDGRTEWRPRPASRPLVTVKPNATSNKLKLYFDGVPAGLPAYELAFKKGAFRHDNEAGPEVSLPTVRLLVKKVEVAVPEPSSGAPPADATAR
jgi:hypothetical protein